MNILSEIVSSSSSETLSIGGFTLCIILALALGVLLSYAIQYRSRVTKSFIVTIAILPAVVGVVMMMVNGSIGAGIAVAGSFSLVRFRSVPGTAREIVSVFIAMAIGLICGMGYLDYAVVFTIITIVVLLVLENSSFGRNKEVDNTRIIRMLIPEDLDYTDIFSDLFEDYTKNNELTCVKTTNLGSLFRLTYEVILKDPYDEKEFIDKLRVRNGNLEISCSKMPIETGEL